MKWPSWLQFGAQKPVLATPASPAESPAEIGMPEVDRSTPGEVVELMLPSGTKIMARRPQPFQLAIWGNMLNRLKVFPEIPGQPFTDPQLDNLAAVVFELLSYCYMKPRMCLLPRGRDEVAPKDVPVGDYMFVFRWALGVERGPETTRLLGARISGNCRRGGRRCRNGD